MVLQAHHLLLEVRRVEVKEHLFVAVEFKIVRLDFYIELVFVGRPLFLAGSQDEDETKC